MEIPSSTGQGIVAVREDGGEVGVGAVVKAVVVIAVVVIALVLVVMAVGQNGHSWTVPWVVKAYQVRTCSFQAY